jgi:hypothetical protein
VENIGAAATYGVCRRKVLYLEEEEATGLLEKVAALRKVAQIQGSVKERSADNRVELLSHQLALSPAESSRVRPL